MRGDADRQLPLFHVFEVEDRIRPDHPLRDMIRRTDRILAFLDARFAMAYSRTGRPSVPPERLLKAMLLMALSSIRSERQACEQMDVNLMDRWFLDQHPSEEAFDATTFTKNRERLDEHGLTKAFFDAVVAEALTKGLCSEHFSVDGTLIESWASAKSFRPKAETNDDGSDDANGFKPSNPDVDFRGQKRTNETHASRTDPEAKLSRKSKGQEAKLAHMGHVLGENRNGLILGIAASEANGTVERAAVRLAIDRHATYRRRPKTVTNRKRLPGIQARRRMVRRMRTKACRLSQRCRKKVEECFGWLKSVARLDRCRTVGRWKLQQALEVGAAAFNLVKMIKLAPAT